MQEPPRSPRKSRNAGQEIVADFRHGRGLKGVFEDAEGACGGGVDGSAGGRNAG